MLECTITNTFAGSRQNVNGVMTFVHKTDDDGNRIRTNSLKVTCSQKSKLPEILSAKRIASAGSQLEHLKFVQDTDYRRVGDITIFDDTKSHSSIYKPLPKKVKI
tara:strand:+ start:8063 stop:8377 length:315 start_codon:yes stop_codon:yes gene_type:complete